MNFTREPIIETIITPRDGYKLIVRSSKADGREEYSVDAVEVVSFGSSLFFRSLERPKSFLLPVSDFEVVETKETRIVLKNAVIDKSIKIGGGKEQNKQHKEVVEKEESEESSEEEENEEKPQPQETKSEKKRDRRRHRRRRTSDERLEMKEISEEEGEETTESIKLTANKPADANPDAPATPHFFPRVLPPPTTLISETLSRYKEMGITENSFELSKEEPSQEESFRGETEEETVPGIFEEDTVEMAFEEDNQETEPSTDLPKEEEKPSEEPSKEEESSEEPKSDS